MSGKSYSKEFKESAVRLLLMEGMSAAQVSQKLGVSEGLLYKWKHQQTVRMPSSVADTDGPALNALFRKQLEHSEKIHEILKNSGVFCGARTMRYHCIKPSMSAKGNSYDNATMESFFGQFKVSAVKNRIFQNEAQVRDMAFEYIEIFYNRFRKHAALGYRPPIEFKQGSIQQQSQLQLAA